MDFVNELRRIDEENCAKITAAFPVELSLCNELVRLYDLFGPAIVPHLRDVGRRLGCAFISGTARNHLIRGTLSLCRAHAAPMFRETRSAAEAAGIAFAIVKHTDMRTIFLDDVGTPATREAVRKTFTQKRIFPKNKKVFRQLSDDYDYCSWRAHTNMATFALHLGKTEGGMAAFQTQDIRSETAATEIPLFFIALCLSHLHILTSVDETFEDIHVTDEIEEFMAARDLFTQKLLPVIWKHRGASVLEKARDEEWLRNALDL